MPNLTELELWRREQARQFKLRLDRTMPEHSIYYCEHGEYIGFNGIFREQCDQCVPKNGSEKSNDDLSVG